MNPAPEPPINACVEPRGEWLGVLYGLAIVLVVSALPWIAIAVWLWGSQ